MGSTVNSIVNVIATAVTVYVALNTGGLGAGFSYWTAGAILATTAVVASALTVKPKVRNSSLQQRSYQTD